MEKNWVDFNAVKEGVTMQMVLDRYQINWLRGKEEELRGSCPIHEGEGQNTFHVSLSKNIFHCFSCKARGNVLDFVAAMEKSSVRDAALKLSEWFGISREPAPPSNSAPEKPKVKKETGDSKPQTNAPLNFQLKGIDHTHPYLAERGISLETAERFGVGFFPGRGSMSGRVVVPIHNEKGDLVAYAGRAIDGSEPRYKLPTGFHKSLELYNLHRAIGEIAAAEFIVVVEGFFDCMKVSQAGFACVALMGSSLSLQQEDLLARYFENVCLMLDADEAGQKGTDECLLRLGRRMWVRAVMLSDNKQPDQLSDELTMLLGKTKHSP